MADAVHIYAPATVANVGPGFDILGFAMEQPGDEILVEKTDHPQHEIIDRSGVGLPLDPGKNVSTVAIDAMLTRLGIRQNFRLTFLNKIAPGSGIGSSAASAAGAVYAANVLLGKPFTNAQLVPFAMKGEEAASGSAHADNVAPCLLGGFILVRSYEPLDIIPVPGPDQMFCSVVYPEISIATEDSRRILKTTVPLQKAIAQCGNVAGLVTGLITGNYRLISDSMHDVIAEPIRSFLIPEYDNVIRAALGSGSLGCSISGSGPSIFALSQHEETAKLAGKAMQQVFTAAEIGSSVFISQVNKQGIQILAKES
jgi:homoserine kinase